MLHFQNSTDVGRRSKSCRRTASGSMIVRDDDPDCIVEGVANRLSPSIATVAIKNRLTATAINSKLLSIKKEDGVVFSFLDGMLY